MGVSAGSAVAQDELPQILDTIPVSAAPAADAAPPLKESNQALQLEEIVVTARRKEESVQDVPISLAVLEGDALGAAGLTLATDLQERVPGLVVTVPNPRLTSFTIRGLGSSSVNDGIESSVGLFLDGVYLGRQGLSIFDLVDLDRVEVLRGPQGTLFGKNTTAGVLNIVTKAPKHEYEATLEGTLGNYGSRQLRGSVTGSFFGDETFATRLTGYATQRDGLIENIHNGHDLNERNKWGLRGQGLWTPRDSDLSWRFIVEYGTTDEECCVYPLVGPVRPAVQARDDFMEYQRPSLSPYDRVTDSDGRTRVQVEQKAVSAELNWDLGDSHRLTSISAWRDWYFEPDNDDATPLKLVNTGTINEHSQLSQEIRLASNFDGFDSVLGLYYLRQDFYGNERVTLGEDMVGWTFGGLIRDGTGLPLTESNFGPVLYLAIPPATLDGTYISTPYEQVTNSAAAFGSINWHLSDELDLTTGLRYTHEWRDSEVSRSRSGGCPNCTALNLLSPVFALVGLNALTVNGLLDQIAGGEYYRATKRDEGNFSGQIALSHNTGETLTYFSISRGYKAGGINLGVTGESVAPTFKPEEATAFELGAKGQLLDRRVSWSAAVYQTYIRNYQALTFDEEQTIIPNPRQINLLNVGQVRLQGVELDAYGLVLPGLLARAGLAYSRAITKDFDNAPNEDTRDNDKDLSGHDLYNAPRWTGTAGLEYSHLFNRGIEAYGGVDYSFRSGYWGTVEHGRATYIDGYSLTNLRLGARNVGAGIDAWLWTRNVFDKDYLAGVYPLYGVGDYGAYAGDPRTYGLTVRATFY